MSIQTAASIDLAHQGRKLVHSEDSMNSPEFEKWVDDLIEKYGPDVQYGFNDNQSCYCAWHNGQKVAEFNLSKYAAKTESTATNYGSVSDEDLARLAMATDKDPTLGGTMTPDDERRQKEINAELQKRGYTMKAVKEGGGAYDVGKIQKTWMASMHPKSVKAIYDYADRCNAGEDEAEALDAAASKFNLSAAHKKGVANVLRHYGLMESVSDDDVYEEFTPSSELFDEEQDLAVKASELLGVDIDDIVAGNRHNTEAVEALVSSVQGKSPAKKLQSELGYVGLYDSPAGKFVLSDDNIGVFATVSVAKKILSVFGAAMESTTSADMPGIKPGDATTEFPGADEPLPGSGLEESKSMKSIKMFEAEVDRSKKIMALGDLCDRDPQFCQTLNDKVSAALKLRGLGGTQFPDIYTALNALADEELDQVWDQSSKANVGLPSLEN